MSINRRAFLGWAGVGGAASYLGMAIANRLTKQSIPARAASPLADLEKKSFDQKNGIQAPSF